MTDKKMKKGFTLIEIVIVLAIAALIMVVVFLAVQGAQRNQRDQTRRDIVQRTKAQLEQAKGNNNGTYPAADATFANTYMGATSGTLATQGISFTWVGNAAPAAANSTCTAPAANAAVITSDAAGQANPRVGTCLEAGVVYNP